jgi:hypothetical protein
LPFSALRQRSISRQRDEARERQRERVNEKGGRDAMGPGARQRWTERERETAARKAKEWSE